MKNSTLLKKINRHHFGHYAMMSLLLMLVACANETLDEPSAGGSGDITYAKDYTTVDLGSYISVRVSDTGGMTRADNSTTPSFGGSFNDGSANEYSLAPGAGHHYMIVYKAGSGYANATPWAVVPLNLTTVTMGPTDGSGNYSVEDNVTLTARSIYSNVSIITENRIDVNTQTKLEELFGGDNDVFLLLNFDQSQIYSTSDLLYVVDGRSYSYFDKEAIAVPSGKKNEEVLAGITRNDYINKLKLKDFKINVTDPATGVRNDYFTMSSAVYLDGNNRLNYGNFTYNRNYTDGAGTLQSTIFDTEQKALKSAKATIEAYVERMAAKISVKIAGATISETAGASVFPTYNLEVDKYRELEFSGQGYTVVSEKAQAQIQILGYGINCRERSGRAAKFIDPAGEYNTNSSLNWRWNDTDNFRSYWSEDNNYFINDERSYKSYPVQFRWAIEIDTVRSYHKGGHVFRRSKTTDSQGQPFDREYINAVPDKENFCLDYFSFKDFDFSGSYTGTALVPQTVFYTHENTYYDQGFGYDRPNGRYVPWDRGAYAAGLNLVVVAKMNLQEAPNDIYRGQNGIFYTTRDQILGAKLKILNEIMLPEGNSGIRILNVGWAEHKVNPDTHPSVSGDAEEGDDTNSSYTIKFGWNTGSVLWVRQENLDGSGNVASTNTFIAETKDLWLIPAEVAGGDGYRLIAPRYDADWDAANNKRTTYWLAPETTDSNGNKVMQEQDSNGVQLAKKITFDQLVSLIYKIVGPVERFEEGWMYYSLPIPHTITAMNPETDWRKLGTIGVVRNNWYNITVNNITGIGRAVDDPEQPIIPVLDMTRSYINASVDILNWHTVTNSDIDVSGQIK